MLNDERIVFATDERNPIHIIPVARGGGQSAGGHQG